jgi:hypothetical protein
MFRALQNTTTSTFDQQTYEDCGQIWYHVMLCYLLPICKFGTKFVTKFGNNFGYAYLLPICKFGTRL